MCDRNYIAKPHGRPHAIFEGFVSVSTRWIHTAMQQLIVAEHIPQRIETFRCNLGVAGGASVLWHSPSQDGFEPDSR